jgi:hypothetical protein
MNVLVSASADGVVPIGRLQPAVGRWTTFARMRSSMIIRASGQRRTVQRQRTAHAAPPPEITYTRWLTLVAEAAEWLRHADGGSDQLTEDRVSCAVDREVADVAGLGCLMFSGTSIMLLCLCF